MTKNKSTLGFTLIELLVSVAIIALLGVGAITAFVNFRESRLAKSDAQLMVDQLKAAQRQALAGDKPSGCGSFSMQGYEVDIQATSMTISAVCSGGLPAEEQVLLRNSTVLNPTTIFFGVLKGGATPVTLQSCSFGRLFTIEITSAGAIGNPVEAGSC